MALHNKLARLQVSDNHRYLTQNGSSFFWLADTGWLLFSRLQYENACLYLRNRGEKGFNVIQAMLLHRLPLVNAYGRAPFLGDDWSQPDIEGADSYWGNIDRVLDYAEEMKLYMAVVPAWGDLCKSNLLNRDTVEIYTRFLAKRYRKRSNIIWIVGGDLLGSIGYEVWNRMGSVLREECPEALITFHPVTGTTSSLWYHNADWLDFHMFQSGHSSYEQVEENDPPRLSDEQLLYAEDNWKYVRHDHALVPLKPTLDAEPSYENIMKGLKNWGQRFWTARDVRRYAYWAVLEGSLGISYGHNAIMQFYSDGVGPGAFGVIDQWKDALHHPGSGQMVILRRVMERFDYQKGMPRQDALAGETGTRYDHIAAFGTRSFLLCYTCNASTIWLKANVMDGQVLDAYWMNPQSGDIGFIGAFSPSQPMAFKPALRDNEDDDWLLIIVDAALYPDASNSAHAE